MYLQVGRPPSTHSGQERRGDFREKACNKLSFYDSLSQMQTITEYAIKNMRRVVFTRQEAAFWAGCDGAALDGEMVHELEGVYRDARVLRFLDAVEKEVDFFLQQCRKLGS